MTRQCVALSYHPPNRLIVESADLFGASADAGVDVDRPHRVRESQEQGRESPGIRLKLFLK